MHRPTLLCSLLAVLAACAAPAPEEARLVGPTAKADGNGPGALFVCRIEPGDSADPFFRFDTLRCELPAEATMTIVNLDVWGADDRHLGSGRLADGPTELRFGAAQYPIRIAGVAMTEHDTVLGLDGLRVRSETIVESAEAMAERRGPELPFEVWELRVESGVSFAAVSFDDYPLRAQGAELEIRGERTTETTVRPRSTSLDLGEVALLRIAVSHGTESLTGEAGEAGSTTPFIIDRSGRYRVTRAGLEPEPEPPARLEPARNPFLSCYGHGALEACRVVPRAGITLASAEVRVDGQAVPIPMDGYYTDIPRGESVTGRVVIEEGLHGLDLGRHGVLEGALTPVRYENARPGEVIPEVAALEAPFDLLLAAINVGAQDTLILDAAAHPVTIDGEQVTAQISAVVTQAAPDVWLAVDRDVEEVTVDATLIGADGAVTELPGQSLRGETLFATPEGLVGPPVAEPVDELIGCWLERGDLRCGVSFRDDLEAGSVTIHLTGAAGSGVVERNLVPALVAETIPVQDLERFFPITLELDATLAGAEHGARVRVLRPEDLPRSRRVFVDAN